MMQIIAKITMKDNVSDEEKESFLSMPEEDQAAFVEIYKTQLHNIMKNEVDSDEINVEVVVHK